MFICYISRLGYL